MSILNSMKDWFMGAPAPVAPDVRATTSMARVSDAPVEWRVDAGVSTDPGCVRDVNEDAVRVIRPDSPEALRQRGVLAIVCDGMGGHEAGEVASALALETIVKRLDSDEPHLPDDLVHAVVAANRAIFETARTNPRMRGMGTTCCTLVLHNGAAYCAHVGDSRCYLLRGDQLFLMTEDHSAVMELVRRGIISRDEARNHPDKNVISRALGSHKEVEVSTWSQPFSVQLDDTFLLCSDGLYDLVDDEQIRLTIGGPAQHVQIACDRLVALARQNGGHDNISVAILRMRAAGDEPAAVMETRAIEVIP